MGRSCRVKITVTIHRLSRLIHFSFPFSRRRRVSWEETLHGAETRRGWKRELRCAIGRPPATCAPIRRVNLPTCFASRRIISRARDIDSSPTSTHHRLIGISYALSVRTVTGSHCPVIYFAPHVCIRNILIQAKTKDNSFDYLTFLLFLLHNDRSKFLVWSISVLNITIYSLVIIMCLC